MIVSAIHTLLPSSTRPPSFSLFTCPRSLALCLFAWEAHIYSPIQGTISPRGETINMASMIFADCSSTTAAVRLMPLSTEALRRQSKNFHFSRCVSSSIRPTKPSPSLFVQPHSSPIAISASLSAESTATVIDGKAVAKQIREEVAAEISKIKEATGVVPGLGVILVGDRKDSATYVRNKQKACESAGIKSVDVRLPENCTEQEVLDAVTRFNDDPSIHGILVQLPLPSHINEVRILNAVTINKDVDGFHPLNIGHLAMRDREPLSVPCTPKGCMELLHRYGVEIKGKRVVVIGRSNIVGMPVSLLLQRADATVTVVHSKTKNPEEIIRQADIVISASGKPHLVRGSWIKNGAAVIDVGINTVEDAQSPRGYRLVGDVCYDEVIKVASAVTPVPGGVGPMTIAMLLSNTLTAAKRAHDIN